MKSSCKRGPIVFCFLFFVFLSLMGMAGWERNNTRQFSQDQAGRCLRPPAVERGHEHCGGPVRQRLCPRLARRRLHIQLPSFRPARHCKESPDCDVQVTLPCLARRQGAREGHHRPLRALRAHLGPRPRSRRRAGAVQGGSGAAGAAHRPRRSNGSAQSGSA